MCERRGGGGSSVAAATAVRAAQREITRGDAGFLSNIQRDTWLIPCELFPSLQIQTRERVMQPVWPGRCAGCIPEIFNLQIASRIQAGFFPSGVRASERVPMGRLSGSILRRPIPIKCRADISANSFLSTALTLHAVLKWGYLLFLQVDGSFKK